MTDCLIVHHTRLANVSLAYFDWSDHLFKVQTIKGVKINKSGFTITQTIEQSTNQSNNEQTNSTTDVSVSDSTIQSINPPVTQSLTQSFKALFIEEAIYYVDIGALECLIDNVPASRQEIYALLSSYSAMHSPMSSTCVYLTLKHDDAVVLRPRALVRRQKSDPSISQSIDQSMNSSDPSMNPSVDHSTDQSINLSNLISDQTMNTSMTQSTNQTMNSSISQSIDQSDATMSEVIVDSPVRPDPIRMTDVSSDDLKRTNDVDMFIVWDAGLTFKRSDLCRPSRIVIIASDQTNNRSNNESIKPFFADMILKSFHKAVYAHLNEMFMQPNVARLPFDFDFEIPICAATVELNRVMMHQFRPLNDEDMMPDRHGD